LLSSLHLVAELVILAIIILCFSVRFARVQTYFANAVIQYVLKDCPTAFSVKYVDTDFFHYLRLKDVNIKDYKGNQLISGKTAWVGFPSLLSFNNAIKLQEIILDSGSINITQYKGDSLDNLTTFINCFPKGNDESTSQDFSLAFLKLSNVSIEYIIEDKKQIKSLGFLNFNDINITSIDLEVEDIDFKESVLTAARINTNLKEKSGFEIHDFIANRLVVGNKSMSTSNLVLSSGKTNLKLNELRFDFDSLQNFNNFIEEVNLTADFKNSKLAFNDLKYFYAPFKDFTEEYIIKGYVSGKISDMHSDDLKIEKISTDDILKFRGKVHIVGLPDVKNTFYTIQANDLEMNKNGLQNLELLKLGNVNLNLPDNVSKLGTVKGSGSFRGYLQGFMSELDITTKLGKIVTDLNFYYDDFNKNLVYDGNLSANAFNVGNFLSVPKLGSVSGTVNINASGLNIDELKTSIKGKVKSINYNNYSYKNISLDGIFEKNHFNGVASINDPNLVANYDGNIDFKQKTPAYSFCLSVSKANLFPMHYTKIQDAFVSFNVDVIGSGFEFENLHGKFNFTDINLIENSKSYHADSLVVASDLSNNNNAIQIWSSILDANLQGKFKLNEMHLVLQEMASKVLPKKINSTNYTITKDQNLSFQFNLKDVAAITDLILPGLSISKNAFFKGEYNSIDEHIDLFSKIDYINYAGVRFSGINLETQLSQIFEVDISLDSISHLENTVKNVTVFGAVFDNNIGVKLNWNDNISQGKIGGNGYWDEVGRFTFDLDQTDILTKNQSWKLLEIATLKQMDESKFHFNKFSFANKNQVFTVEGDLGKDFSDLITIRLDSVNLSDVLPIKSYQISGQIDAFVQIRSALQTPMILGRLTSDIIINDSDFGKLNMQAWMTGKDSINIHADIEKLNKKNLDINGYYLISNEASPLNFNVLFKEFNLEPINVFLPAAISNLKGLTSGSVILSGTSDKPSFIGDLSIKKGNLKVTSLNTEYGFEGDVVVEPDLIFTTNAKGFDAYGTRANILSASFYHTFFKDYSYEFSVQMRQPFLALNTTKEENSLFYGRAFATGQVNISYDKYNLIEIDVEATSHKNTEITLPLYGAEEVSIGDFISFVKFNDTAQKNNKEVNLSGITMNLNLTATPDAKIKMVFDELVGDEIEAYGSGNIFMEIDQYDQFKMYGQYELDRGEYLFTLKDLINKKFQLKKGGTVSWYGDPYNAEINVSAIYNVRTSVASLVPEEERQKYTAKQDVECEMNLSNSLFSPNIAFGIELPRSSDQIKSIVKSTISTKEELERQFFSLLILNSFMPRESSSVGSVGTGLGASTSELLTNQVNQILDKWISGLDVGINYLVGDNISNEEFALALSTQLFSDKLLLSGNFGMSQNRVNPDNNTLIGDVTVEYIIDSLGIWRVKAFNQSNTYDPTRIYQGDYTQGVGLSYQKSFNNADELKLWYSIKKLFKKREEENEQD
jgi:hypothetical protein